MMRFDYHPVTGLEYRFDEIAVLEIEHSALCAMNPQEILEMFYKQGVILTSSQDVQVDPKIYLNGVPCDHMIEFTKADNHYNSLRKDYLDSDIGGESFHEHYRSRHPKNYAILLDEAGHWQTADQMLENEIIRMLNE